MTENSTPWKFAMNGKEKIPDMGVVLSEDADNVEVLFEGFDIRRFLFEIAVAEQSGENSEEVVAHLRELFNAFENHLRQRYEIRVCVWKNRYAAANDKTLPDEQQTEEK